jgi:uncharacterized protein (DUF362 family)
MIVSVLGSLPAALDDIGLGSALRKGGSALIKVNLARPPEPGHPRTDPGLLEEVIRYISDQGASCAIAEAADGFLRQNVESIGLDRVVHEYRVAVLDLDQEDFDCVLVEGERHYLPRCLINYAVRIGIPATSKRPDKTFSNNVKLFVGAVPRRMYQIGEPTNWRPRVHVDLHRSVANIYRAVMQYAPFHYFVNGGKAVVEGQGEIELTEVCIGDNALELDLHMLGRFGLEPPEYVRRLEVVPGGKE